MYFNAIRENKILAKISGFTVRGKGLWKYKTHTSLVNANLVGARCLSLAELTQIGTT